MDREFTFCSRWCPLICFQLGVVDPLLFWPLFSWIFIVRPIKMSSSIQDVDIGVCACCRTWSWVMSVWDLFGFLGIPFSFGVIFCPRFRCCNSVFCRPFPVWGWLWLCSGFFETHLPSGCSKVIGAVSPFLFASFFLLWLSLSFWLFSQQFSHCLMCSVVFLAYKGVVSSFIVSVVILCGL